MFRRKLELAVFTTAALASIATSPKRWMLEAQNVPAIPDPTRVTRVIVHAPAVPTVDLVKRGGKEFQSARLTDLGNGDYETLVPPDWGIYKAYLSGRCKMSLFCGGDDCGPPDDWVVTVKPMTSVATWRIEIATPATATPLDPRVFSTSTTIKLDSTRPARVKLDATSGPEPTVNTNGNEILLYWRGQPAAATSSWFAHISIEGPCPTTAECKPPASEHVSVVGMETKTDAPR